MLVTFHPGTAARTAYLVAAACGLIMSTEPVSAAGDTLDTAVDFDIPAGTLADSLERFGAQTGLQIVYDSAAVQGKQTDAVAGLMSPREALELCLDRFGIAWDLVNGNTVVLRPRRASRPKGESPPTEGPASPRHASLSDLNVLEDPRRTLPREPSAAAFGFDKPVLETPRSISVISVETIDLLGLSAVEDLVRVVPGVFTTTRWGIQGSIDVRNVPADTYFRGMKRLNLQGHGRSVLGAMETIEIVKGPPSPIYGMGKIGGYTNMEPKSVRAATGGYQLEPHGFVQTIYGAYERSELSFGVGGPLTLPGKQGGYYVYGLFEDSNSFVEHVPVDQRVIQAALTIEDFAGRFRLETGINLQRSGTAGALIGRFTQDVADTGRYVRGAPLVGLDANGNGRIGYLEMYEGSPVRGDIDAQNRALRQYWAWPVNADGSPLPMEQFPAVAGIPEAMYDYLVTHPEADPGGLLRAQGSGGPLPVSGYVPAGFALDPRTVRYGTLDPRRSGAFERELQADFATVYFDLIRDRNADLTIKNQLFFDMMDQYKLSEQPFSQIQKVRVVENKLTATRRLGEASAPWDADLLASANLRYTSSKGYASSGDYGTHRTDAMHGDGMPTPNATFATALLDRDLDRDGLPWTRDYDTESWELGAGLLFDIVLLEKTNVLIGGRVDWSKAGNVEHAGTLDLTAGTSANPAVFAEQDVGASGRDTGVSWSVSVSHELPRNVVPYVSIAETSLALDGNNNKYSNAVIEAGHIGRARLIEIGLKANLLGSKLFFATAAYEQARRDVSEDDGSVLDAHVSSTITRGWEAELKWVPSRNLLFSLYALKQKTRFRPNVGDSILVDARALGFQDVVDSDGNVVFPAEAFLYGGRSYLVLPPNVARYEDKQGNPETQVGFTAQYELGNGLGLTLSGNYFSRVYAGRLQLVELPETYVLNAGVFWDLDNWHVKWDVFNALDERYFRSRTGDTLGDVLVSAMPGRRWQVTARTRF